MTRCSGPTPNELDREPQLAVLHALEGTLWAARMALFSAHAELREDGSSTPTDPTVVIASTLVQLFETVGGLLPTYRHALDRRLEEYYANVEF